MFAGMDCKADYNQNHTSCHDVLNYMPATDIPANHQLSKCCDDLKHKQKRTNVAEKLGLCLSI